MSAITLTPFDFAQRFIGITELPGPESNPFVLAMLRLDTSWPVDDAVPWCSAYVNFVCHLLRLPRSKSLRARSWLAVGAIVPLGEATADADIVILDRATPPQPSPLVLQAPGHVGFFAGLDATHVHVLGGNQSDRVSIAAYPRKRVLGVRRVN